jgi:hypothetical protein
MIAVSWESNKERVNKTFRQTTEISKLRHGGKLKNSMFQKHKTKSALTHLENRVCLPKQYLLQFKCV